MAGVSISLSLIAVRGGIFPRWQLKHLNVLCLPDQGVPVRFGHEESPGFFQQFPPLARPLDRSFDGQVCNPFPLDLIEQDCRTTFPRHRLHGSVGVGHCIH